MLYVFQVDLGCMYTFELNLSLESVSTLKSAITAKCNISVDNQVLLISGGDYLEDNCVVHQYNGAGTVSNPIFLFNKSAIMSPEQYSCNQLPNKTDQFIDATLKQIQIDYEQTQRMDASLKTIIARTDVAKKLNQITTELMSNCEQLIRDQHLMYQGWQAVIANLDDVADSFVEHVKSFEEQLKLFLTKRDYHCEKLKNFEFDLQRLNEIKTLPCLHLDDNDSKEESTDCGDNDEIKTKQENDDADKENVTENTESNGTEKREIEQNQKMTTYEDSLMNLISKNGEKHCLNKVAIYCRTMLEQFTEPLLDRIKEEMTITIKTIDENKKIKKIESRLYNLDMLLIDVRQHVQDQNLLTLGFIQNQNSANAYNDSIIFKDLCSSHEKQFELMFKYLNKAMTIKKKFQNSKRELTYSLLARLKTIMICETDLSSLNWRVLVYSESLKKLKRSVEVVDQINLAPKVYFSVFQEVNRRNKFNFFFNLWSKFIVQTNSTLIENENRQRNEFRKLISNHFLKSFFPKFDDNVPDFATQMPDYYDQSIPLIDEKEFQEFIEQNKMFDNDLESEDNLLNGLVCRINGKKCDRMQQDASIEEQISEGEKKNLVDFVDSLFPIKQKHTDEIELIKQKLSVDYERKLNELKGEFKLKLEQEIMKLNSQSNSDLTASSISNNISTCVDPPFDQTTRNSDTQYKSESSLFFNFDCSHNLFKNLINELLTMKYSTYLKENECINGPSWTSFVSTIFSIMTRPNLR